MINGEKELWRAVVLQALRDISHNRISPKKRREARRWFCTSPPFFFVVCDMADLDADTIRKKALKLMKNKDFFRKRIEK